MTHQELQRENQQLRQSQEAFKEKISPLDLQLGQLYKLIQGFKSEPFIPEIMQGQILLFSEIADMTPPLPGRGQQGLKEFLQGYKGYVHNDRYTVYDKNGGDPDITITMAGLYSFFGSCKMCGINPQECLTETLQWIPVHSI